MTGSARDLFVKAFLERMRELGETRELKYDPERFVLEMREGEGADVFFLAKAFADYEASGHARSALDAWAEVAHQRYLAPTETRDEAMVSLMPRVRYRATFAIAALEIEVQLAPNGKGAAALASPHRPIADVYAVGVCHDTPTMVMDIGSEQLDRWSMTFDEALEIARTNLRRRTHEPSFDEIAPGVYASRWRDTFDVTRILLDDVIRALDVRGEPLAFLLE